MTRPPNFFKNWKANGFRKAREDFSYHFQMDYSPEQGMKTQIYGYIGSILGIIFVMVMFYLRDMWFVSIASFFAILIMWANLRMCIRQKKEIKEQEKLALELMEEERGIG